MNGITLENVRTHNLKGVSLTIDPRGVTMLCGVSGSGKSSLAFDTLYVEGQRRFLATLSPSAQELLGRFPPPDADRLEHIPPTIALRQDEPVADSRTTVGTATDLHELLAMLFVRAGRWRCPTCDAILKRSTIEDVVAAVTSLPERTRVVLGFSASHLGPTFAEQREMLKAAGFVRGVSDGQLVRLSDLTPANDSTNRDLYGVVDRVTVGQTHRERIAESVATAFRAGVQRAVVMQSTDDSWQPQPFDHQLACPCGFVAPDDLDVDMLSHRSPRGVCETCSGLGIVDDAACPTCRGARVGAWAERCEWEGRRFADVLRSPLLSFEVASCPEGLAVVVASVTRRFDELRRLGLGHLSLARGLDTLSSGERLRVRLASVLAADGVDTLVVLDEPTASLHPADIPPVVAGVQALRDQGQGVIVVEHSPALTSVCDRVIELGPGAGHDGGEIVFDGETANFAQADTKTAVAFRQPLTRPTTSANDASDHAISISGLGQRVLNDIDVDFPVGQLTVVTGVSGAGKTTLLEAVRDTTVEAMASGTSNRIENLNAISEVEFVEQKPPARTGRSCVATQTKALDEIRKLFAAVPEANARGLTAKHFSFNAAGGGRCEHCQGRGEIDVAMGHLSDLTMTCPQCGGARYETVVLDVKFRRKSIADVLAMTVDEAVPFFRTEPLIRKRLQPVRDVGLGYLPLSQPLGSLSGGEAQRLHLATHLTPNSRGPVLFLLDEPARGLHPVDVNGLMEVFERLVDVGHTVVIADHEPRLLTLARHVIDLDAGNVQFAGTPSALLADGVGFTADVFRERFAKPRSV